MAKKLICALNCMLLTIAEQAVDKIMRLQKPARPDVEVGLPRFSARSINTSNRGVRVTRNLYAVMNCCRGELCHILVAMMGTKIPSGRITVGDKSCSRAAKEESISVCELLA